MDGIVMLVNEFAPVSGGAEKQAERLASYMVKRHKLVWVITRRLSGLAPEETMDGFRVLRPPTWGPGKLKTVIFVLGTLWKLWQLRHQYMIIHAHMLFGPAFAAVLAGKFLGKSVIVKLGSSGPDGEIQTSDRTFRGRLRLALLRKWANAIVVLDDVMQAEAIAVNFSDSRIFRMVNGIDAQSYSFTRSLDEAKSVLGFHGKIVVLFVGRLVKQKSLPTLFGAFQIALSFCSDMQLVLVGDGPERDFLETLACRLNIQNHISFVGNRSDVKPYLNAADLFVLPSETEGMSNALLEAMASGLACLATPVGASAEMLAHGKCGVLLPVGDTEEWGRAIVEIVLDPIRRTELGQAAQRHILEEYDFSVIGTRYEDLYANLLKQASGYL